MSAASTRQAFGPAEISASTAKLIGALQRNAPSSNWTPADHRQAFESAAATWPVAEDVQIASAAADAGQIEIFTPDAPVHDDIVLYLHGGGFMMGSLTTSRPLASLVAARSQRRVITFDYPLAPESTAPRQVDAVVEALRWIDRDYAPLEQVNIMGDSAGGNLALAAAQAIRDDIDRSLRGCILLSPFLDLTLRETAAAGGSRDDDPQAPTWLLEQMAQWYLGTDAARDNPGVSPLFGSLSRLPPILIQVATNENLLGDSLRLHAAAETGVDLQLWADGFHAWHYFAPRLPSADAAVDELVTWLDGPRFAQPSTR